MTRLIELQDSVIATLLMERTRERWRDYPEFSQLIESLQTMAESNGSLEKDNASRLVDLFSLAAQHETERTKLAFRALEAYCAIADPFEFAVTLAKVAVYAGEPFPLLRTNHRATNSDCNKGMLENTLDYREGLQQKGDMFRRLWKVAMTRGEGIEIVATRQIIQHLDRERARRHDSLRWSIQTPSSTPPTPADNQDVDPADRYRHDLTYMLHCGPLQGRITALTDLESLREALVMVAEKSEGLSIDQQLQSAAHLLERLFVWIEDKETHDDVEYIKTKVSHYAKTPILLYFVVDSLLVFMEGRWLDSKLKSVAPTTKGTAESSLLEMNMRRLPVRYFATEDTAMQQLSTMVLGQNASQAKSLRERIVPEPRGRSATAREFELSDLFARCIESHGFEEAEQLMRRIILHLGMRVDTAMVGVTPTLVKYTAQQRDKILLQIMSETPVYRQMMVAVMECDIRSASICGQALLGMLRSLIAHWNTCKNTSPTAYPKDLETTTWLGQLIEKTGLVPYPASLAYVLFPLVSPKDIGAILEQVYFANVVQLSFRPSAFPRTSVHGTSDVAATATGTTIWRSDHEHRINNKNNSSSSEHAMMVMAASGSAGTAAEQQQPQPRFSSSSFLSSFSSSGDQGEAEGGGKESSLRDPELQLIHRIIFKHAARASHLLPLFCIIDR